MPRVVVSNPILLSATLGQMVPVALQGCDPSNTLKAEVEKLKWVAHAIPSDTDPHGWAVTLEPGTKWNHSHKSQLQAVFEKNVLTPSKS